MERGSRVAFVRDLWTGRGVGGGARRRCVHLGAALAVALAAVLVTTPVGTRAAQGATVATDVLRLRAEPGTWADIVDRMYDGDRVEVLDGPTDDGWYRVSYYGEEGWAKGDFLRLDGDGGNGDGGTAWVATDRLNVRAGPSRDNDIIGKVSHGDALHLTGRQANGFVAIDYGDSGAWVFADYLSFDGPPQHGGFVNVPAYSQQHNLSCEYASLFIATSAFGGGVPEDTFIDLVGWSDNPHWGYRGDIDGWWGGVDDYGVYPEALAAALPHVGFSGDVFYGDVANLKQHLDWGMPTLVWLDLWFDSSFTTTIEGQSVRLAPGDHVVVAYGYDGDGLYVSDPARGTHRFIAWGDFIPMWDSLGDMALAVAPA